MTHHEDDDEYRLLDVDQLADWQICHRCGSSFQLPARGGEGAPEPDKFKFDHAAAWQDAVGLVWPGVLTFPLHRGVRGRLAGLTVVFVMTVSIFARAIQLAMSGIHGALPGVCLYLVGVIFGGMGAWYAAAVLLAVLEDTACGDGENINWPGLQFTDWYLRVLYIINALAISAVPGMLASLALGLHGHDRLLAAAVSLFGLFPIVLLSLEENDSAIQPFSITVLKFVARGWWLWLLFYGLVIAVAAALGAAVWLFLPRVAAGQNVAVTAAAVTGLLIYFRMLGRLVRE